MTCKRFLITFLVPLAAAFWFSGAAQASGGNYVFEGGTPYQQQQVRAALNASSFNWSLVTEQITIDIAPVAVSESIPGTIFLDPSLLNSGEFSWGVVQNEYANQVDFYLLTPQDQAPLTTALGGTAWCYADEPGLQLAQYACERFASALAWSYWQSPDNCINPSTTNGEAGGMAPAAFRALIATFLGPAAQTAPVVAPKKTTSPAHASATKLVHGLAVISRTTTRKSTARKVHTPVKKAKKS